jgi:predicted TIM-barrel fold metal-dependent hydrolase
MWRELSDDFPRFSNSIDVHVHLFNYKSVPDKFLGFRIPFRQKTFIFLRNITKALGFISQNASITGAAYFLDLFRKTDIDILQKVLNCYPADTILCPLLMDMEHSIGGKEKITYQQQIDDMYDLCELYPGKLLPFLCLNPLNPHMYELFNEHLLNKTVFWGVKIYPSLGYLPSDKRLLPVYKKCEELGIPIIAHSTIGPVHITEHHLKNINGIKIVDNVPVEFTDDKWFWTKNDYAEYFNHPRNWESVMFMFPGLILNLAHFGGFDITTKKGTWTSRIINLMTRYSKVYSDISFVLSDKKIIKPLRDLIENNPIVADKVLYGTDYYMIEIEGHFRDSITRFSAAMGQKNMDKLYSNNKQFLFHS